MVRISVAYICCSYPICRLHEYRYVLKEQGVRHAESNTSFVPATHAPHFNRYVLDRLHTLKTTVQGAIRAFSMYVLKYVDTCCRNNMFAPADINTNYCFNMFITHIYRYNARVQYNILKWNNMLIYFEQYVLHPLVRVVGRHLSLSREQLNTQ